MHIGDLSQPMPRWVHRVFLEIISRILCLTSTKASYSNGDSDKTNIIQNGLSQNQNPLGSNSVETEQKLKETPETNTEASPDSLAQIHEAIALLRSIKADMDAKDAENAEHLQWRQLSIVLDRILLYLFTSFTLLCTLILCIQIIRGSANKYDETLRELDELWH